MQIDKELIKRAKETLGDKNAEIIASLTGMRDYNPTRKVGCCPNPAHDDKHPSCSFNPKTQAFYCFSCGYSIDIIDALMIHEGKSFIEACEYLFSEAGLAYDFSEKGVIREGKYNYPAPEYADNIDTVAEYWAKRRISRETLEYAGVRQDTKGNTLFQYFNDRDVLVGCKVRLSRPVKHGETKCWWNGENPNILYNFNKLQSDKPLIIVSGEGDALAAIECGFYNVASINGGDQNTQWVSNNWDFLQEVNEIILVHDNDESGRKFAKDIATRLGEYRVKIVDIPKFYEREDGKKVEINDLNELLFRLGKDAVRDAINGAKDSEIPAVVDYSDISKFDMSDVDGFRSGFAEVDNALDKFYVGTTNIITGICGSGKSSFISSLVCQSVDQGYPAFVYSGELSNPSLKNWIDCVHAGQSGLSEHKNGDISYYRLRPEIYKEINEYYKKQIYIYRDSYDNTVTRLLSTMEALVRKCGVKTIIIDNMSIVDLEANDTNKWTRQDEFIRSMIDFSKRWQTITFIVLHPRKMDTVRRMNIFDLQGVVSAVNLAHRVISLYRINDKDREGVMGRNGKFITPPMRGSIILDVLKDRYGSGAGKSVSLWYDVASKRFYDSRENLAHKYNWDQSPGALGELPFGSPAYDADSDEEVFGAVGT